MRKSRLLVLVFIIFMPFVVGCASNGMKKPTVFVDKYNNIPADIPSQFLNRYERFITSKESKEFEKLLTDEERQVFIDKFWAERDTDPTTSENEKKQKIDERIDDITNERFFSTPGTTGLLFRSNGGFRGDMAQVYLLYGEPDAMDTIEGPSFASLMLWVYVNPENGSILYAFLFYQKGSLGAFFLFPQDAYKIDPCGAINEIKRFNEFNIRGSQGCPSDMEEVFREIQTTSGRGGILDGYIFAWSLFNFSQDSSILQGKALEPPKPAAEIAKQSKATVTGEASKPIGTAGTDYILASCDECNSFIPAEIKLVRDFLLAVHPSDIDWRVVGDQAEVELKIRVVLENTATNTQLVFEKQETHNYPKDFIVRNDASRLVITLLHPDEVSQIPVGTYRVNVYVKNMMTKKYNAWSEIFTK